MVSCGHEEAKAGATMEQHRAKMSEMDRVRRTRAEFVAQSPLETQAQKIRIL
jgi:hypothetical protein